MERSVQQFAIDIEPQLAVSAILVRPPQARICFVFAHGAGAGMTHAFMESVAQGLAKLDIATLRYQFPYVEKGSRRPDPPALAQATVRAAVAEAAQRCPGVALIAGGKSFGARMTSQAQAKSPLAGVRGLAFFGFPLHPAGKPSTARADHLDDVTIPMLFLQGTRDKLGTRATLRLIDQADHAFHVPARSGRNDQAVLDEMLGLFSAWSATIEADQI
jgi:predicted alpha/beta-hydrolase family hydrolase